MNNIDLIQIANLIAAFFAVPPSLFLIKIVMKEREITSKKESKLNFILLLLFSGVALGALLNAFIALLSLSGYGSMGHSIAPFRSLTLDMFFAFVAWGFYGFYQHRNGD